MYRGYHVRRLSAVSSERRSRGTAAAEEHVEDVRRVAPALSAHGVLAALVCVACYSIQTDADPYMFDAPLGECVRDSAHRKKNA